MRKQEKNSMQQAIHFEIRCPHCNTLDLWGLECALRALVKSGRYRTRADFDPDMIRELFIIHADKIDCLDCGQKGLSARIAPNDNCCGTHCSLPWTWADEVCCKHCGKIIPPERLAAVPGTMLCVQCQSALERGDPGDTVEYCPRCGEIMTLKSVLTGGITRYEPTCPNCRPRSK